MSTPEPMTMLSAVADEETVRAITEDNIVRIYRLSERATAP
jgi:hypothetical protein